MVHIISGSGAAACAALAITMAAQLSSAAPTLLMTDSVAPVTQQAGSSATSAMVQLQVFRHGISCANYLQWCSNPPIDPSALQFTPPPRPQLVPGRRSTPRRCSNVQSVSSPRSAILFSPTLGSRRLRKRAQRSRQHQARAQPRTLFWPRACSGHWRQPTTCSPIP